MAESREAFQAAMHEAHELAWALRWEAASQKYREALALVPNDPTARLSLAVSLSKMGRLAEALREYLAARELLPRDALVLARIAELYLRLGEHDDAIRATIDLAALYAALGEGQKAQGAWRSALEHASGQWRHLHAIREAMARAGDQELLPEVEAALAQTRPEQPPADATPARPTVAPSEPEGSADRSGFAAPGEPSPAPARAQAVTVDDPAHRLAAAQQHVQAGKPALATADYLRAAELLADLSAASSARRAAVGLVGGWLGGDLGQVAGLPPKERGIVLEAMADSHVHLEQGILVGALDDCFRAIGAGPAFTPAQLRLAEVYRRLGRVDEARARVGLAVHLHEASREPRPLAMAVRQQVVLDPEREELRRKLVDCLIAAGEADEAADELLVWADRRSAAEDANGGLELQREAIRIAARPDHWLKLGESLEELGRTEEALDAFRAARALAPAEELVAAAQTRCEAVLGHWRDLEANLEPVLAAVPGDAILAEEATGRYRAALARLGGVPALHYCLGAALQAMGQAEEARLQLARAASSDERPGRLARLNLARLELASGELAPAIAHLRGVGYPSTAANEADRALALEACELLAGAAERAADWSVGARAVEELRLAHPENESLYTRLGQFRFRAGDLAGALATLDKLANLYRAREDPGRAAAVYQAMAGFAPDAPEPCEKLGRLFLELGQTNAALAQLEQAAMLQVARGLDEQAAANLRVVLDICRVSDPPRALAAREKLAALRPGEVDLRRELVASYLKAGRSVKALAEARSMVDYLLDQGQLDEAAGALRLVVQLDPWNLAEQVRLGNLLAQLDRTSEAETVLKRVLGRDPNNQAAARSLAVLYGGMASQE